MGVDDGTGSGRNTFGGPTFAKALSERSDGYAEDRASKWKKGQSKSHFFNPPEDRVSDVSIRVRSAMRKTGAMGHFYQAKDLDEILWDNNPRRVKVAQMLCDPRCKFIMATAIFFSIGLAVHETNLGAQKEDPETWFNISMNTLTGIYSCELIARVYVSGPNFFLAILNLFDVLLVLTDIVMFGLESATGGAPNLFALRLVRLVRTLRIIRILTVVRPLYLILHGLVSAMQAIFWATILLILSIMLWGILAVNFLHPINQRLVVEGFHDDCLRCQRAFASVSDACLTFAETTIAGETFGDVSIPIIEEAPISLFLFLGVHITIQLGIMNLILAVIVDQAQAARFEDAEQALADKEMQMLKAKDALFKLCLQMDTDFSGSLTLEELLQGVDTLPDFMNHMRLMDISREDMEVVFRILDSDKSGDVNYREFVEELHKLKSRDSHTLLIFIKHYVLELRDSIKQQVLLLKDYVETDNFHIHEDLTSIYEFLTKSKRRTDFKTDERTPEERTPEADYGGSYDETLNSLRLTYHKGKDRRTNNYARVASSFTELAQSVELSDSATQIQHGQGTGSKKASQSGMMAAAPTPPARSWSGLGDNTNAAPESRRGASDNATAAPDMAVSMAAKRGEAHAAAHAARHNTALELCSASEAVPSQQDPSRPGDGNNSSGRHPGRPRIAGSSDARTVSGIQTAGAHLQVAELKSASARESVQVVQSVEDESLTPPRMDRKGIESNRASIAPAAVAACSEVDDEDMVCSRGLLGGGEPEAGAAHSPSDMAHPARCEAASEMALWDVRAASKTHHL